jgi:triacylglycerol lipase
MRKKKVMLDYHFEFEDDDLQQLFEPFNPPKEEINGRQNDYPIVLAHGFARPDYLIDSIFTTLNFSIYDFSFVSDRFHYFKGIASFLKKHNIDVHHSRVSWAADVKTRAKDLKQEVERILKETGKEKVHIIAHSMGGLDARYMIVNQKMADAVFSLTTIGTPHLGSIVADYAVEQGLDKVLGLVGSFMNLEGVNSLTTRACNNFNIFARESEACNDVIYQVFYSKKDYEDVFIPFQPSWKLINKNAGDNDGLVSVASQKWTKYLRFNGRVKIIRQKKLPINADHFDQTGWWNLNDFHKAGWWNLAALNDKNKHEEIIKNVYLKIAKDVYKLGSM